MDECGFGRSADDELGPKFECLSESEGDDDGLQLAGRLALVHARKGAQAL
jgi:hypothetical protein